MKFVFSPIPDSRGVEYSFTLSSPAAGAGETLEVFILDKPTPEILEYSYEGEVHPGGVPLVTFHKPDSRWQTVKEVYLQFFARLLPLYSQKFE